MAVKSVHKGNGNVKLNVPACAMGLHRLAGTWGTVANVLGVYSGGYWHLVAHGKLEPSRKAENALRRALGFAPRGCYYVERMPRKVLAAYIRERKEITWQHRA